MEKGMSVTMGSNEKAKAFDEARALLTGKNLKRAAQEVLYHMETGNSTKDSLMTQAIEILEPVTTSWAMRRTFAENIVVEAALKAVVSKE